MKKVDYTMPLLSWDIYSVHFDTLIKNSRTQEDLRQLQLLLENPLQNGVIDIVEGEDYDALIVTDTSQKIQWVNTGFFEMTGYPKSYAIGKTPHFLQGLNTLQKTKDSIRKGLDNHQSFTESVVNYKRSGEEYLCEIKIIPLLDDGGKTVRYLAIEKEIKAA